MCGVTVGVYDLVRELAAAQTVMADLLYCAPREPLKTGSIIMALSLKDIANWTLDDLLEAINPPPPSADEQLRRALVAVIESWQNGEITDE